MPELQAAHRRHRRVNVRMAIRIATIDPEPDPETGKPVFRSSQETCANVSRGGAFVTTNDPIAPGRRVLLELPIPGGACLEAIGRVAWSRTVLAPQARRSESGIGIEFLGGAPEQLDALDEYIERRTRRAAGKRRPSPRTPSPNPAGGA